MDPTLHKLDKIIEKLDVLIEQGKPPEVDIYTYVHVRKPITTSPNTTPTEIDDNTPDCNCNYHSGWHHCDFHGWCNSSIPLEKR